MALRKRPIAAGVAAFFFSSWAAALGLGEIQLNSALNEPLDAEIRLHNTGELGDTEILAGLASAEDFANAGLERELILSDLDFRLDFTSGSPVLRVTSQRPIREPYLDFLVDVQWPSGRVLREYTLLLDLPVFSGDRARPVTAPSPSMPPAQSPGRRAVDPAPEPSPMADWGDEPEPLPSGEEYQVGAGDTLWRIASRLPGEASVHRKMAAIQRLNPDAFIAGNINLLRAGQVLRLPDYGEVANLADGAPAATEVAAPDPAAATDRAEALAPQLSASDRDSGGEAAAPAPAPGRLKLSAIDPNTANESDLLTPATASPGAGGGEALRGELALIQDELARTQRENVELKDRLSNLEEQLGTLQQLVVLEDGDLRAAQLAAAAGGQDADNQDGGATAPEQNRKTESQSDKGWFDTVSSYLAYIVGFVVVLIGVLVALVLRKRGREVDQDDDYFPVSSRQEAPPRAERREPEAAPVSSVDDIALREDDQFFTAPAAATAVPAAKVVADEIEPLVEPSLAPEPAAPARPAPAASTEIEDLELDLSEFELDDVREEPAAPATPAAGSLDDLNLDDFDFGDTDEGDTQLELAQAYLDMGDNAGAREILQEVMESGNDQQKAKAQALLAQLH